MKAIQVRYLPCTDTKPARLKAWTDAGQLIESFNGRYEFVANATALAEKYISTFFLNSVKITGFGCLPNGDYVATIA